MPITVLLEGDTEMKASLLRGLLAQEIRPSAVLARQPHLPYNHIMLMKDVAVINVWHMNDKERDCSSGRLPIEYRCNPVVILCLDLTKPLQTQNLPLHTPHMILVTQFDPTKTQLVTRAELSQLQAKFNFQTVINYEGALDVTKIKETLIDIATLPEYTALPPSTEAEASSSATGLASGFWSFASNAYQKLGGLFSHKTPDDHGAKDEKKQDVMLRQEQAQPPARHQEPDTSSPPAYEEKKPGV